MYISQQLTVMMKRTQVLTEAGVPLKQYRLQTAKRMLSWASGFIINCYERKWRETASVHLRVLVIGPESVPTTKTVGWCVSVAIISIERPRLWVHGVWCILWLLHEVAHAVLSQRIKAYRALHVLSTAYLCALDDCSLTFELVNDEWE